VRNWTKIAACAAVIGMTFTAPALADDPDFFVIGGGWYDFNDDKDAFDFRAEYRSGYKMLGFLKPWAGIEATSDEAIYGVVGVLTDIYFGRRWVLTPSFGAGAYGDGNGKDLGHMIESGGWPYLECQPGRQQSRYRNCNDLLSHSDSGHW